MAFVVTPRKSMYMNEEKKSCRGCHRILPEHPLLQYNNMPKSAQYFPDEVTVEGETGVDINIYECRHCGLLQASGKPVPYYRDVIRATGVSDEMRRFRVQQFKGWVEENDLQGKKIIEIGCGKGEYMAFMEETQAQVTGLEHLEESVLQGNKDGHAILQGFVEDENIMIPGAPYDAFYIMNFLEHIPNPGDFLVGIANNLAENAVGLVEVPNINMILEQSLYSEFIQDHLSYFTSQTLRIMLELNGFEVLECDEIWYRYIISIKVRKRKNTNTHQFEESIRTMKDELDQYFSRMIKEGKTIAGWGAGHQALANLSLLKLQDKIKYIIDSAEFKQNKFTPATHIPIVAPDVLSKGEVDAVLIMAAGYSDEIKNIILDKYPEVSIAIMRVNGLEIIK